MIWLAAAAGLAVGSLPTASLLARSRGVDLLSQGSTNPGTNNAFRLGGPGLAIVILLVEIVKGAAAVWIGGRLSGDYGSALAGASAVLGNVYNPLLRFRGGKGLGISAGTILAAWPAMVVVLLVVIALSVGVLRRSGPASLITFVVYLAGAALGPAVELPGRGLIGDPVAMLVLAVGSVAVMMPKHLRDTVTPAGPPRSPR